MMDEYIKREDAIKHLRGACIAKYPQSFSYGIFASADEISKLPTADVVEVVRCKDCVWWEARTFGSTIGRCENPRNGLVNEYSEETDFCSYGERKE